MNDDKDHYDFLIIIIGSRIIIFGQDPRSEPASELPDGFGHVLPSQYEPGINIFIQDYHVHIHFHHDYRDHDQERDFLKTRCFVIETSKHVLNRVIKKYHHYDQAVGEGHLLSKSHQK